MKFIYFSIELARRSRLIGKQNRRREEDMTIQLYFSWDEWLVEVADSVIKLYKKTFFFLGFVGVAVISFVLSPILYLLFLVLMRWVLQLLSKEVNALEVHINNENYKAYKSDYDATVNLIEKLEEVDPSSQKIPLLLKPIVNTVVSFKNILIQLKGKLIQVEAYLSEQGLFLNEIPVVDDPLHKDYKQFINNRSKKAISRFMEDEEPFTLL